MSIVYYIFLDLPVNMSSFCFDDDAAFEALSINAGHRGGVVAPPSTRSGISALSGESEDFRTAQSTASTGRRVSVEPKLLVWFLCCWFLIRLYSAEPLLEVLAVTADSVLSSVMCVLFAVTKMKTRAILS